MRVACFGGMMIALLPACCLTGCGGAKKGQLPAAQVTGQVTYRGAPLAHGEIKFIPVQAAGKGVRVAYGNLDEQGRYRLSTYGQGDGAILGDFCVVVESREELPPDVAKGAMALGKAAQRPKSLIPPRYAHPDTSGLTAHVASKNNAINFELKQ